MEYKKKIYKCIRCNLTTNNRYNFQKHLNRKKHCNIKNNFDFDYDFLLNKFKQKQMYLED